VGIYTSKRAGEPDKDRITATAKKAGKGEEKKKKGKYQGEKK